MFKSTFKLLLNNFSMVWKILLYKIVVLICVVGLTSVVCLPIIKELISQGFFVFLQDNLSTTFLNFNLNSLVGTLVEITNKLFLIVKDASLLPLLISASCISIILYYFVDRLSYLAVVDDVHSFMSSNLKLGFMNCFVANFGKSAKLGLIKLVTTFILNVGIIASACGIYYALSTSVLALAPLVTIAYAIIMFSLKITLFAGVEPSMVVNNCGIIEALKRNFKAIQKKWLSIFSNTLIMVILLFFLNMFAVFFTFGITLLITVPITILTTIIFKNVVYYECTGMRYYCDSNTIIMPKKLEEQDNINRVKDII